MGELQVWEGRACWSRQEVWLLSPKFSWPNGIGLRLFSRFFVLNSSLGRSQSGMITVLGNDSGRGTRSATRTLDRSSKRPTLGLAATFVEMDRESGHTVYAWGNALWFAACATSVHVLPTLLALARLQRAAGRGRSGGLCYQNMKLEGTTGASTSTACHSGKHATPTGQLVACGASQESLIQTLLALCYYTSQVPDTSWLHLAACTNRALLVFGIPRIPESGTRFSRSPATPPPWNKTPQLSTAFL